MHTQAPHNLPTRLKPKIKTLLNVFEKIQVVVVDEIHSVRTMRGQFTATQHLSRLATLTLGMSATPIYTHPKVSKLFVLII